jgi:tRNA/tmRNA/rRNA uracil-C5-methylase (TrmA/RlmC/RlmD family)
VLFTLGLARRFERVVAVEAQGAAARDLVHNAAAAALPNVRVVAARAEAWLAAGEAARLAPDAIVLDPPRGGVGREAAQQLACLPARRLAHLSCDPATLARDLGVFAAHGWRLLRVRGFDLFPQTPHVEALALLERPG